MRPLRRNRAHLTHPDEPLRSACGLWYLEHHSVARDAPLPACGKCPRAFCQILRERARLFAEVAGRPLLVLDFDGVFNHRAFFDRRMKEAEALGTLGDLGKLGKPLDRACIARAQDVAKRTHAVAVVSSAWRSSGLSSVREDLRGAGFMAPVIAITRELIDTSSSRTLEIGAFLDELPAAPSALAILDDDPILDRLAPFHVRCDPRAGGFTDERADLAIAMLRAPPAPVPWRVPWLHLEAPDETCRA